MAKKRLCTTCIYYNNGWCNKRRTNKGLKDLLECSYKVAEEDLSSTSLEEKQIEVMELNLVKVHCDVCKKELTDSKLIKINESKSLILCEEHALDLKNKL